MELNRRRAMAAFAASATASMLGGAAHAMAATGRGADGKPTTSPVVRPDAEQFDMTSRMTGRSYRIFVAKPSGTKPAPAGGYPVIYLNDGDFEFHTAADALMMQSIALELAPAYIVGIGYGKGWEHASRTRCADLTPSQPDPATLAGLEASPLTKGATYGEAERYHRFMTEELRPLIEANHPVSHSDRTLWGHSFGGLFALHVLFNHPEAYRTYLVNSPSINWGSGAILKDESRLVAQLQAGKVAPRVLLTAGEYEETLADHVKLYPGVTREQMQAALKAFAMVTNTRGLAERLRAIKAPTGTQIEAMIFDGETHLSAILPAMSRGLRFALPA
jgi:predicted alpha/beta superfamily hydrolase